MSGSDPIVCGSCGTTSCWNGVLMCERAYVAGICTASDYAAGVRR